MRACLKSTVSHFVEERKFFWVFPNSDRDEAQAWAGVALECRAGGSLGYLWTPCWALL